MGLLIAGLALFFATHLLPLLAPGLRVGAVSRIGTLPWKGLVALLSLAAFWLMVVGYGESRQDPTLVFAPPDWGRHVAHLLTLLAFVLLAAAYSGRNHFRARFGHPMVLGAKAWALGHLFANGFVHDLVLFGGFLAWGVLAYILLRRRDRARGVAPVRATMGATAAAVVAGLALWFVFARWLHPMWIGVPVFPG